MSALPFRGPSKTKPGERVVILTHDGGEVFGEVMWCQPSGVKWNVFVLEDGRRTIWQSPIEDVERVSEDGHVQPSGVVQPSSDTPSVGEGPNEAGAVRGPSPADVVAPRVLDRDGDQERLAVESSAKPQKESPRANDGPTGRVGATTVVGQPGGAVPYGTVPGPGAEGLIPSGFDAGRGVNLLPKEV